jgi:hypothetical protein
MSTLNTSVLKHSNPVFIDWSVNPWGQNLTLECRQTARVGWQFLESTIVDLGTISVNLSASEA